MKKISLLLSALFIALSSFGQSADGLFKTVTASGTNTYTIADPQPSSTAYDSKEKWLVTFTNASTGNVTLNRAGIGAKIVRDSEGTQLASGDILAGQRLLLSYNGTYYQVVGGSGGGGDWGDIGGTLSAQTDLQSALDAKASTAYADAKVAQTITNGVTTSAPSQDAVADALAALPVVYNVVSYGAVGNAQRGTDAAISTGTDDLTCASCAFVLADVGKTFELVGAGAAGARLTGTIIGFVSSTAVTLSLNASTTVSAKLFYWGTDDTAAFAAAIAAAPYQGSKLLIPAATAGAGYLITGALTIDKNMIVQGEGSEPFTLLTNLSGPGTAPFRGASTIYFTSPTLNLFTLQGNALTNNYPVISFYDLSLVNVAGSVPTAGAGIKMAGDGMAYWTFQRMHVDRFYDNFNFSGGLLGRVRDCQITQPVRAGAYINITTSYDLGGFFFERCLFTGNLSSNSTAKGIWWVAGGVVEIINSNFNTLTYDLPTSNNYGLEYGYYVDTGSTHSTSEHKILNTQFNNIQKTGIYVRPGTFILARLLIANSQVNPSGTSSLEQININNVAYTIISNVEIGSTSVSGQVPIKAQNCDQLVLGPITYGSGYTLLNDLTGSTVLSDYSNGSEYSTSNYPVGMYLRKDVNGPYIGSALANLSTGSSASVSTRWGVNADLETNYFGIGLSGANASVSGLFKAKTTSIEANAGSNILFSNFANDDIIFATNSRAEKMRISGTGHVSFGGNAAQSGEVRILEDTDAGSNYTSFLVGSQAGNVSYTLPTAAPTISGHSLQSTTGGTMSWAYPTTPLSSILGATGNNTIDNGAFTQQWQWNTLAGANGFHLTSTSTAAASNAQSLFTVGLSGANATTTQTTYAGNFQNSHTGTLSTNVGLFVSASGATNNYGILVNSGRVGIGLQLPLTNLHVQESVNAGNEIFVSNNNTGGSVAATVRLGLSNTATNTNYLQQSLLGTNFTTAGLLTARMGFYELNSTAHWMFSNFTAHDLIFATNSRTERMRISSNGKVSIPGTGITTGSHTFQVLNGQSLFKNGASFDASNGASILVMDTLGASAAGAAIDFWSRGVASYTTGTQIGTLHFLIDNTSAAKTKLSAISTEVVSGTAGVETSRLKLYAKHATNASITTFLQAEPFSGGGGYNVWTGNSNNLNNFPIFSFSNSSAGVAGGAYMMLSQDLNPTNINNAVGFVLDGTGFSPSGMFRQDAGGVQAGTNLSGGLFIAATNSSGIIDLYTGGSAAGNRKMLVDANGVTIGLGTSAGVFRISEPSGSGSNFSAFTVAAQSADITYTLPTAVATANGQVLTSTTAGAQSWSAYSILTGTGTLNFDLTAVNSQDLTITVTGAATGDAVSIGLDAGSVPADITFFGWVSATNTVTVRCSRVGGGGAVDPASGTFRASVIHY